MSVIDPIIGKVKNECKEFAEITSEKNNKWGSKNIICFIGSWIFQFHLWHWNISIPLHSILILYYTVLYHNIGKWTRPFSGHSFSGLYLAHCNWRRFAGRTWLEANFQEFLPAPFWEAFRGLSVNTYPIFVYLSRQVCNSSCPRCASCVIYQVNVGSFLIFPKSEKITCMETDT